MLLVVIILLILHVLLALVYTWDWFRSYGRLQEAAIRLAISLFLPLVGVVVCKLVDYFHEKNSYAQMDELYLGRGELTDELQLLRDVNSQQIIDTAPAVDVLSLDEYGERRRMVMDTLRQSDTADYMDVLRQALANEDQETSHYASVVIMDLQQQMRERLAERERRLARRPGDADALLALEKELYQVIQSGAIDVNNLPRYYERYEQASDALLVADAPDAGCFHRRIAIDLKRDENGHAQQTARRFVETHPDSEDAVMDSIRVCVRLRDRAGLDKFLDQLGTMPVMLTERSLRYIRFLNSKRQP